MARRGGGGGRGGGGRGFAGGSNGTLSEMLDPLDEQMQKNYYMFKDIIISTWETFSGNEGQMTIVENHIMPMSKDFVKQAKDEWPWSGDADEYIENVFASYDTSVIERAFSGTIYSIYDEIVVLWMESDELQQYHDDLLGHSAVHSTNPPWNA